ncbi:TetR/AcrR family transcriptional regulator [Candidatus Thiothrix sp. Deng01]|uniref:TetR/AcrR family transcriptional regulator n=1 Tax=Candidatus Thiothrix phosphatis TaxID=3112415 RepID=A0ABU6CXQ9_9GAMM|nr:TetR/AcrR family transcriptional regulator [Candidatus Thiothrix sp. Deng01]MEB4591351.1 TetR/AcrR family transcriptional regulator [Candidatus Thiothrix sp. Deng01]
MSSKREILIDKATELFASGGYTAIGIDRILAEAGVAKMTMYKHFPSKQHLILAVLKQRDEVFRTSLITYVKQHNTPIDKLRAVFKWHHEWFARPDFSGCMFINASAEFQDATTDIHQAAAQHKQLLTHYLETLLGDIFPASAKKLAVQINILLDGAIVAAQVTSNHNAAKEAWEVAECLLKQSSHQQA